MKRFSWFGISRSSRQSTRRLAHGSHRLPTFERMENRLLFATRAVNLSSLEPGTIGVDRDHGKPSAPPVIPCWSDVACKSLKAWCDKHNGNYGDLPGEWGYCSDYDTRKNADPERDLTLRGDAVDQILAEKDANDVGYVQKVESDESDIPEPRLQEDFVWDVTRIDTSASRAADIDPVVKLLRSRDGELTMESEQVFQTSAVDSRVFNARMV